MINFNDNKLSGAYDLEIQTIDCPRCRYKTAVPEHLIDYKALYEELSDKHRNLRAAINEAMSFTERMYDMNPFKDQLRESLLKLRDKYNKEDG